MSARNTAKSTIKDGKQPPSGETAMEPACTVDGPPDPGLDSQARRELPAGKEMWIPFSKLFVSPDNVRTKYSDEAIEEMAATILEFGLIQNLTVVGEHKRGKPTGRFGVAAGGRRYWGVDLLVSRGKLDRETPLRCELREADVAVAASLVENTQRLPLHPADEFEAYRRLVAQGKSREDIAAAFGVTPLAVERRLRLANVAPSLIAVFREGGMTLEQLMAFAVTDNHAQQEALWRSLPEWSRSAGRIRQALTADEIPAHDRLARFVTLEAYTAAGGRLRRDLFAEDDDEGMFLADTELLNRLAAEKLETAAEAVHEEGWAWVETYPRFDPSDLCRFDRLRHQRRAAMPEIDDLEERLRALDERLEALAGEEEAGADEEIERLEGEYEELRGKLDAWETSLEVVPDGLKRLAGGVVTVDYDGELTIHRGLVRPEDRKAARSAERGSAAEEGGNAPAAGDARGLSDALVRRLTTERTAALQAALAVRPDVALVALVHRLALDRFYDMHPRPDSPVEIAGRPAGIALDAASPEIASSRAYSELQSTREQWQQRMPERADDLFGWLLSASQDDLLGLLAYCVAAQVNTVQNCEGERKAGADIAMTLAFDMADWWGCTAANFLTHVSKGRIIAALNGHVAAEKRAQWEKLKKKELIQVAEPALVEARWLPPILRYEVEPS